MKTETNVNGFKLNVNFKPFTKLTSFKWPKQKMPPATPNNITGKKYSALSGASGTSKQSIFEYNTNTNPSKQINTEDIKKQFFEQMKNTKTESYLGFSKNNLKYYEGNKKVKGEITKIKFTEFIKEYCKEKGVAPILELVNSINLNPKEEINNNNNPTNNKSSQFLSLFNYAKNRKNDFFPNQQFNNSEAKRSVRGSKNHSSQNSVDKSKSKKNSAILNILNIKIPKTKFETIKSERKKTNSSVNNNNNNTDNIEKKNLITEKDLNGNKDLFFLTTTLTNRQNHVNYNNTNKNIIKKKKLINIFQDDVDDMLDLIKDLKDCEVLQTK
jgi:hypothetical protein